MLFRSEFRAGTCHHHKHTLPYRCLVQRDAGALLRRDREMCIRDRVVGIFKAVARLQHSAVSRILRLGKVHVAGGNDRLVQIFASLMTVRLKFLMSSSLSTLPSRTM